jgi:nitroreductase
MASSPDKLVWRDATIPKTGVSVYEALYTRRMAWKFKDKAVPRDALERMLDTAIWAPNHRLNEPWRFFVLPKDSPTREKVGDTIFKALVEQWDSERRAAPYRDKIMDPPMVVYVYHLADDDWFVEKENYAAVTAAVQNINLAGVAEGLAVTWDTGWVTRIPAIDPVLGAEPGMKVMTMLSIGYADEESESARTPVSQMVRWV